MSDVNVRVGATSTITHETVPVDNVPTHIVTVHDNGRDIRLIMDDRTFGRLLRELAPF